MDDANHVITGACADFANKRDSQCIEQIIEQTKKNLNQNDIELEQVLADTGYSSGEALKYLDDNNIDAWIPNFGQYKPQREGFEYDSQADKYTCHQGKDLPFKKIVTSKHGDSHRVYRSSRKDCNDCPFRSSCIGKSFEKTVRHTIHKAVYDKMHQKLTQNQKYAKRMVKVRSKTVEPVLGTLINFTNMKRVNTRGIKQANKHVIMAALTYNLKKYLKFIVKKPTIQVQRMTKDTGKPFSLLKQAFHELKIAFLSRPIFASHNFSPKINLV